MPLTSTIDGNQCIGDSLDKINTNFSNLDTAVSTVSSAVVVRGFAKAWVSFSGNTDSLGVSSISNTDRLINSNFGVSSVLRTSTGSYTVNFLSASPVTDSNYVIIPSVAGVGKNINSTDDILLRSTSSFGLTTYDSRALSAVDPVRIDVVIYGN